ncbi:MAG: 4-oxalomesaconate tautomerase, partial [Rhodospirillales bacterium]
FHEAIMTDQRGIPFMHMRGGTSKGPVFNKKDLPEDRDTLAKLLISATGSGHIINIDGIGAGNSVTTKVPILSNSDDEWADVDYFFVQVQALDHVVDFNTTCGNMLSTVGPAALEMGLVEPQGDTTEIKILAVNTGGRFVSTVQTPGGKVVYEGDASIDGVPGTAAPIQLRFMDITGSATDKFAPTGNLIDTFDGFEVTCMDVTMPVVIGRAKDFGITGYETISELDDNKELFEKMESVRLQAGEKMGMGDVSKSVMPKIALFAPAKDGGTICTRYFMPWQTHPTLAATSSQCLAACALTPGTVADGMLDRPNENPAKVRIEHPLGALDVTVDLEPNGVNSVVHSAEILRTARKLTQGEIFVPSDIWVS